LNQDSKSGFGPRFYRNEMGNDRFNSFVITCKDSDLWIGVDKVSYTPSMIQFAHGKLIELRYSLEKFICQFPRFGTSYTPVDIDVDSPEIAILMCQAAKIAGVGPMAAVAGAFSEYIGKEIQKEFSIKEIVVENGGDIYMNLSNNIILSIYAGNSNLTGKIRLKIPSYLTPVGICTSAGNVGPSVSFGKADAVMITCKNTALADAYATTFGNMVTKAIDIPKAIELTRNCKEVLSAVIICENQLGISGEFELCPFN
jgi:uncharacterized protein